MNIRQAAAPAPPVAKLPVSGHLSSLCGAVDSLAVQRIPIRDGPSAWPEIRRLAPIDDRFARDTAVRNEHGGGGERQSERDRLAVEQVPARRPYCPCFASNFKRRALSLMKPAASFWS